MATEMEKRLPLDAWHRDAGAAMAPFAGYAMPVRYGSIVDEHNWARSHASLFDVSHMGQLLISGGKAAEALGHLLPADVAALKNGRMCYSMMLNNNGGIIDDLMLTRMDGDFGLVVNASRERRDVEHLREHLPREVSLNVQENLALLALQGPEAAAVLSRTIPGTDALRFMTGARFDWDGCSPWISRSGYTGEDGFEISLPAEKAEKFATAILADERAMLAGLGARDTLRLEAGLPLYGQDLTEEIDPISADLGFAIPRARIEHGGWIGRDAIADILESGLQRRRVGLVLEGRLPARAGAVVNHGEDEIGQVTSGSISPTRERPIAMALVYARHAEPGTALTVSVRSHRLDAEIVPLPFVPHRYHRAGASR